MALPLAMLKPLQISQSAKLSLAAIFGLASFIIVFDILRTAETLSHSHIVGSTALWTNLEAAIAIIVSCLPSFVALLRPRKDHDGPEEKKNNSASRYPSRPLAISVSAKRLVDTTSGGSDGHVDAHRESDSDRSASPDTKPSLELIPARDPSGEDVASIC